MTLGFWLYGLGAAALAAAALHGVYDDITGWFEDAHGVDGSYYTTWPQDGDR